MADYDIVVLGCGWSGISIVMRLLEAGYGGRIACIDKSDFSGGLMGSEFLKGFVFDVGGSHIMFSKQKDVLSYMLGMLVDSGIHYVKHTRKSYIYLNGQFVPYPLENGIWVLEPELRSKILIDVVESLLERKAGGTVRPRSFLEWIYSTFGKTMSELYFIPYNEKIWKRDLSLIDSDWVYTPGRLPFPNWKDIARAASGIKTEGYLEQSTFYYPMKGGIKSLYLSALNRIKGFPVLIGNYKVEFIEWKNGKWMVNGEIPAKRIVYTLPLNSIHKILVDADSELKSISRELDYNKVAVIGVGLKRKADNMHWVYVPDRNIVFHRYAWISNYSPFNAPSGYSSIIAEVTIKPEEKTNTVALEAKTIEGLKEIGVIDESEKNLIFSKVWVNPYGYPIYKKGHSSIRSRLISKLEQLNIFPFGRWGLWHYWNMDKILAESINFIREHSLS